MLGYCIDLLLKYFMGPRSEVVVVVWKVIVPRVCRVCNESCGRMGVDESAEI